MPPKAPTSLAAKLAEKQAAAAGKATIKKHATKSTISSNLRAADFLKPSEAEERPPPHPVSLSGYSVADYDEMAKTAPRPIEFGALTIERTQIELQLVLDVHAIISKAMTDLEIANPSHSGQYSGGEALSALKRALMFAHNHGLTDEKLPVVPGRQNLPMLKATARNLVLYSQLLDAAQLRATQLSGIALKGDARTATILLREELTANLAARPEWLARNARRHTDSVARPSLAGPLMPNLRAMTWICDVRAYGGESQFSVYEALAGATQKALPTASVQVLDKCEAAVALGLDLQATLAQHLAHETTKLVVQKYLSVQRALTRDDLEQIFRGWETSIRA